MRPDMLRRASRGAKVIDPQIASQFRPFLLAGEHVTWTGRPARGFRLYANDIFLVPFSLMWGGFAVFWELSVLGQGGPSFFSAWGVPFVVIGFYIVFGRFVVDAWIRGRTVYALTNQRALLLRRLTGEKLLTSRLGASVMERGRNGAGTLRFGGVPGAGAGGWKQQVNFMTGRRGMGWDIWTPALNDRVEFLGIDDVMTPYRLAGADTAAP